MSVSGRPVFVLRGAQPSHRDIRPGQPRARTCASSRAALARMGFSPGRVDGRYDGATAVGRRALVRARRMGALRRDRHAARPAARRPGGRGRGARRLPAGQDHRRRAPRRPRSRRRASTCRPRATPSSPREHDLASQARAVSLALANERRDNALAAADVALKRAALNKARDALDRGAAQPRRRLRPTPLRRSARRSRPPCGRPATTSPSRRRT